MPKPWFGAKRYGLGLSPVSLEGWVATAAYIAAMTLITPLTFWLPAPVWIAIVTGVALTVGFVALTIVKSDGQPWRWRWGGR